MISHRRTVSRILNLNHRPIVPKKQPTSGLEVPRDRAQNSKTITLIIRLQYTA